MCRMHSREDACTGHLHSRCRHLHLQGMTSAPPPLYPPLSLPSGAPLALSASSIETSRQPRASKCTHCCALLLRTVVLL